MELLTRLAGGKIELSNPLMIASGPLSGSDQRILEMSKFHPGAIATKTISAKEPVLLQPFMYGEKEFIMNAEPWSEYPAKVWEEEFFPNIKEEVRQPLFISLGYSDEDMHDLIPRFHPYADAFELSTHYVGKDLTPIQKTLKMVRELTDKPVYMKISPHFPDPVAFAQMVMENGGNGIVAMNSLGPSMKIDLAKRSVKLGNASGEVWMSGPRVKPVALALVHKIKEAVPECEIIGVGGVENAEDVLEFLLAGADAVQMLSAALINGKDYYQKIVDDLPKALEGYGFTSVQEVIDTELDTSTGRAEIAYPEIASDSCVNCGLCKKVCPFFAIEEREGAYHIDKHACMGCGLCQSRCPKQAIHKVYDRE